jgi:hypothetical protein
MTAAIVAHATADEPARLFGLWIVGNERIDAAEISSVRIDMAGPGDYGSLDVTLEDPTSTTDVNEWDEIRFAEHAATRSNLFGGFVSDVAIRPWAAAGRSIAIHATGYGMMLPRKVIASQTDPLAGGGSSDGIGQWIQSLVSRYGGGIAALAYRPGASTSYQGTVERTIFIHSDWVEGTPLPTLSQVDLESAVDAWAGVGTDASTPVADEPDEPIGYLVWVDAYRRLHAMWRKDSVDTGYDGAAPVDIAETTGGGLVRASSLTYHRTSSKMTSAYVRGSNAAGSGMVRAPADPHAGDIESVVDVSTSDSTSFRDFYGRNIIASSTGLALSITATIESVTPIDLRPGQSIRVTSTGLGLSSQRFRIMAVSISFKTSTARTYTLTLAGHRRSIAREITRFQPRSIGQ